MHQYNLGFISDKEIYQHVKATVESYRRDLDLQHFNQNIIDPIKLTFDSKVYDKSIKQIIEDECLRQIDKSNANKIGYFHQNIFRYAGNGWTVPKHGFDVENNSLHIFAEIKNNSIRASSLRKTIIKMQAKLLEDKSAVCYLVNTDSKNQILDILENDCYDFKKNDRLRFVSINKFFEIVFQDIMAYQKLCSILPQIIDDVLESQL